MIGGKTQYPIDDYLTSCHRCPNYKYVNDMRGSCVCDDVFFFAYSGNDTLFKYLEDVHNRRWLARNNNNNEHSNERTEATAERKIPWGSILDAGTGSVSLEWITKLNTER